MWNINNLSEMKKFSVVMFASTYFFMMIMGLIAFIFSYYVINKFYLINLILGYYWFVYLAFILSPLCALIFYIACFYKNDDKIIQQPKNYVPKVHYIDDMVEKTIGGE